MNQQNQKKRGPFSDLFAWAAPYKGQYALAMLTAVMEVHCAILCR